MTQLLDIFAKKPKKEPEKPKIIVDYREKNSLVPSELVSLGLKVEFRELKVADYIANSLAIERKTVQDFVSSMLNKRILRQLEDLQQYKNKMLIVEGIEERELYSDDAESGVSSNAIRGFILSILLKYKIPIVFSKDYKDTARFISVYARKRGRNVS